MTHVVTSKEALAADLAPLAETINSQSDLIHRHEIATQEETIVPRLLIGQSVARAKDLFGLTNTERARLGGEAKSAKIRRNLAEPETPEKDPAALSLGFQAWLRKETPGTKLSTANKYAAAFSSLSLPHDCKPAQIKEAVKTLRNSALKSGKPALSLAYIIKAAAQEENGEGEQNTAIIVPQDTATLRLQDAREAFQKWQDIFEKLLAKGSLDDLDKPGLQKLQEFNLGVRDRIKARLK